MDNFYIADRHIIESGGSNSYANTLYDESKMEVVKAFNNELVSLYDIKPPISKAKMTAITKAAMKSVRFYKHVVHGVEKFILKCRPDYKIPGLYVIDSIVRQSRHQFGIEKDVFAPRFSKNLLQTFKNICLCPEEDKQKLVRVINLWQKHKVFPEDLLKKFLVMAEASEEDLSDLYRDEIEAIQKSSKKSPSSGKKKKKSPAKSGFDSVTTPLQNSYYSNSASSRGAGTYSDNSKSSVDPGIIQQLQTLTTLLQQSNVPTVNASPVASVISNSDQVKFDKKLLDYDYGEEEEETGTNSGVSNAVAGPSDSITSILTNPDILRQLHTLQVQLSMAQAQAKQQQEQQLPPMMDQQRMMMNQQIQAYNQAMIQQQFQQDPSYVNMAASAMQNMNNQYGSLMNTVDDDLDDKPEIVMEKHGSDPLEVIDLDRIATPPSDRSGRRSYSRSRSRSSSRSRSRSRRTRSRRSRSRSWNRDRSRDREHNEDRRRRALPPIKRKHLAVCSTTLWVGHLSKLVQEQDLSDTFGQYGDIVSIDLIPPRGCAFLCMNRRQDADRALHKLKNTKIHGKAITIAWAPGKGMKGREWKDYWEVDYGVSYIPWSKLTRDTDYDLLEEGGMLDQETMPEWLKVLLEEKRKISYSGGKLSRPLYTPSGTDMDESDNDGDEPNTHSTDMIIETTNGMPEQMIPLPDGPQPNPELQPPLGIPMPPGQNPVPPPPNLLNPFGLPPRLLAPVGVLGGNFIPPLGVPPPVPGLLMPQQRMVNRLPPPFPGPPGLPMLNPGSCPNPSLAQIPLPDSTSNLNSVSSVPTNEFKPPPFGLTPPLLFPGNPNIKIDLSGNPLTLGPGNQELADDDVNVDKNPFASPFKNLPPFNPSDPNSLNRDFGNEDIDYRILGDISNPMLNDSNAVSEPPHPTVNNIADKRANEEANAFNRDRHSNDYDRERYGKFHDRNRNFDNKDHDRFYDRNHRFGDGRSPYREDSFENDRRDNYRRSRFDRDFDRDYKRGRDFRGGRGREPPGPNLRFRPRSRDRDRDRDRYRDTRRDFPETENRKRGPYDRYDRNVDASAEETHRSGKRSRWSDANVESQPEQTENSLVDAPAEVSNENETLKSANDSVTWAGQQSDEKANDSTWTDGSDESTQLKNTTATIAATPKVGTDENPAKGEYLAGPAEKESSTNNTRGYDTMQEEADKDYCCDEEKSNEQQYSWEEDSNAAQCNEEKSHRESFSQEKTPSVVDYSRTTKHMADENREEHVYSDEIRNESMDVESEENSQTGFQEDTHTNETHESASDNGETQEAVPVVPTMQMQAEFDASIKPPSLQKNSNTFDMFADEYEEPVQEAATEEDVVDVVKDVRNENLADFWSNQKAGPLQFTNRVPLMGHLGPHVMMPPLTSADGSPSGPFSGMPNFQRPPFLGPQSHPTFFMQGPPTHFSPFADPRPPRPFMP